MAGMRNPALVVSKWPSLAAAMIPIRRALKLAIENDKELRDHPLPIGENPVEPPPSRAAIAGARSLVCRKLGLTREQGEAHHEAGKWRHMIVGAVQRSCDCPDKPLQSLARTRGSTYAHHCSHCAGRPLPAVARPSRGIVPGCKLLDKG